VLDGTLKGESLDGRAVLARRISNPQNATPECRILFISPSERGALAKIFEVLEGSAILTVSDMPEFAERGGAIQFVMEGERVRFSVNLPAAERAGLGLSSELLRVALRVIRGTPPGDD
jgi:hypothetical protein